MHTITRRSLFAGAIAAGGLATLRGDELDPLFAAPPGGQAQPMMYRQGVVVAWDRNTLANVINVGGSLFTDLPVNGVAESQTLAPGAVVGIMCVGDKSNTWSIIGRSVIPGTAEAAEAVSLLDSQVRSSQVFGIETCTSSTFTDLATIGPIVNVNVGPSGRLLAIASSQMQWSDGFSAIATGRGDLGIDLTGANVRAPDAALDPLLPIYLHTVQVPGPATCAYTTVITITGQAVLESLNPGDTAIKLMYRKSTDPAAANPDFARRTLTIIRL
jgi:hypothetical protein